MDRIVSINVSKDGGYNFSDQPREVSLGEIGEYQDRATVRLRRFGHAKTFTFSIETTSPVKADLLAVYAQIEAYE